MRKQRKRTPLLDRFWPKVAVRSPEECWNWIAARDQHGYGKISSGGSREAGSREIKAHTVAYTVFMGPVPEGLELDHLCRNPSCVNPAHLEPVTHAENMRRGMSHAGLNFRKTECIHGHAFTPDNTRITIDNRGRTHRQCRECGRQDCMRRHYAKKAAAAQ